MTAALTWKNFDSIVLHSSDSSIDSIDRVEDLIIDDKLILLKKQIGEELFNQLSFEDKVFMSGIIGSIKFKHSINFSKLSDFIRNYDENED